MLEARLVLPNNLPQISCPSYFLNSLYLCICDMSTYDITKMILGRLSRHIIALFHFSHVGKMMKNVVMCFLISKITWRNKLQERAKMLILGGETTLGKVYKLELQKVIHRIVSGGREIGGACKYILLFAFT